MGRSLWDAEPEVREVFRQAESASGLDITAICFGEQTDRLNETPFCYAGILTLSCAIVRCLNVRPAAMIGHSFALFTAAVASGAVDLEDALRALVRAGEIMEAAWPAGSGLMAAVLGV